MGRIRTRPGRPPTPAADRPNGSRFQWFPTIGENRVNQAADSHPRRSAGVAPEGRARRSRRSGPTLDSSHADRPDPSAEPRRDPSPPPAC
ncbi:hypothetical protein KPATCC21470_4515 [Kitasatospora purpeofusca]